MWIAIVLILVAGMVYVFKSCLAVPGQALDKSGQLAAQLAHELQKVAAAFKQGTLTTTFTSYATSISGNQYFQFATLNQTETFTRKDESTVAFGYIPLPDVIVQATAPVTYTYYLDLTERWDFRLDHGVIYVTAPDIKFNKPAVDASRITYEVKKNSMIRNTTDAMENLKRSITSLSYQKARTNVELVREKGRQQTEAFVQNWLARSFADGKVYAVKVRFRDEEGNQGNGVLGKPGEGEGGGTNQ
jgi:hypothetical protein